MKRSALSILREDKAAAARFAEQVSKERARKALERAQRELNERLQQAVAPGGPGAESFTAAQLRSTLEQVRAVLGPLTQSLKTNMLDIGKAAAATAASNTATYVQAAEDEFGLGRALPLDSAALIDAAVAGTNASLLRRIAADPNHPGQPGVIARYGLATMGKFEESLQQRLIQGKPWEAVKADLVTDSPFLQQAPAHWAERLLRTEAMFASNKGSFETFKQVEGIVGEMLKILVATFDDRTGADSYAVHGQIRRTSEAFESWFGPYMHPPNRPNDREVVVPHNMSWPLPPDLKALSDSAVAARWAYEGRKGSPPPRPLMSTVDVERIGVVDAPPLSAQPASGSEAPTLPEPVEREPARMFSIPPPALPPSPEPIAPVPTPVTSSIPEFRPGVPLRTADEVTAMLPDYRAKSEAAHEAFVKLDQAVADNIRRYTGSAYEEFNAVMRKTPAAKQFSITERQYIGQKIQKIADGLQTCREQGLTYQGEVYRGLSITKKKKFLAELSVGKEWTTPSFTSTSLDPAVAERFATDGEGHPVIMRFRQRTGVPIAKTSMHEENEREVLLDRGIKFRIAGVEELDNGAILLTLDEL